MHFSASALTTILLLFSAFTQVLAFGDIPKRSTEHILGRMDPRALRDSPKAHLDTGLDPKQPSARALRDSPKAHLDTGLDPKQPWARALRDSPKAHLDTGLDPKQPWARALRDSPKAHLDTGLDPKQPWARALRDSPKAHLDTGLDPKQPWAREAGRSHECICPGGTVYAGSPCGQGLQCSGGSVQHPDLMCC
jgi:hypothetical protein